MIKAAANNMWLDQAAPLSTALYFPLFKGYFL